MRVTNNMMTMNLLYNINNNLSKMSNYQDQLATGKRISKPSDDPVLASKVLARRTDLAELEQYSRNTEDALGWVEISEKAIEDNGDMLHRIKELSVQASNGILNSDDTKKIKVEIENLRDQFIANANSTFAGRYIFSGYETDKKLLKDDGTFNIDIDDYTINNKPVVKYEISVGESIDVMTSGLDIYGYVPETNIMTTSFPDGDNIGTASSKEYLSGTFDLTLDYTGQNLDVTIQGVTYNVDETMLNGTLRPLEKGAVLEAYNDALGVNGSAYFNANDQLVIESNTYGDPAPAANMSVAASSFAPAHTMGADLVEATLTATNTFVDPLTVADRETLLDNNFSIIVNGVSRKIKPDITLVPALNVTTFTVAEYVSNINVVIDNAFGSDVADFSINGTNNIEITTKNSLDSKAPVLSVDFPRASESQLIADLDELIGYLDIGDHTNIQGMVSEFEAHTENMLSLRADIGARTNRMDLVTKRIASNSISFTKLLSDAEDADMSEVIMLLKNAENVYKASLSTGAKVIQPSLVDFLR